MFVFDRGSDDWLNDERIFIREVPRIPVRSTYPPMTPSPSTRKRRFGASIEVTLDGLKDALFPPQGINVSRRPSLPDHVTIRDWDFDPAREVLRLYLTGSQHYREPGGRVCIFELCQRQEPPNVEDWFDSVPITEHTTEEELRQLLKDPVVGRRLRILAKAILSVMLSE